VGNNKTLPTLPGWQYFSNTGLKSFKKSAGVFHNTLLYLISTSIPASGALVMLFQRTSTTLLRCCTLNSIATLAAADSTLSSKFVAMTQFGSNLGSIVNETNSDRNTFCLNKTNIFCMVKIHRNLVGLASIFCW